MGKGKKIGLGIGIGFGILIVLGALGSYVSDNTNESEKNVPIARKENPAKVGDTILVGDISYTIDSVFVSSSVGNDFLGEKADGMFIILNLEMENKGKESVQISSNYFKLIDSQNRVFETDNEAWIYLEKNVFLKQLQPSLPTSGQIVFDVPLSGDSYTLKITNFYGFDEKFVSLGDF